jgi:plastocyanin domain-containing protein
VTTAEWLVVLAGLGLVIWINWYFLRSSTAVRLSVPGAGAQEVQIIVRGGYEPAAFVVGRDRPVRLVFDRQERDGCSEEVVFPALGVRRFLAPFERTVVELPPAAAGTYEFTCGMSMLRGRMIVE